MRLFGWELIRKEKMTQVARERRAYVIALSEIASGTRNLSECVLISKRVLEGKSFRGIRIMEDS